MSVKVYTSIKETYDQTYVGYMIFGDKDQEYALNVIKTNKHNPITAHTYGVMSALCWVRNNKPLYCDTTEVVCYSNIKNEDNISLIKNLQSNKYIKGFTNNIMVDKVNTVDKERLYQVTQKVDWKIMSDKYNKLTQFNKLSGRE